MIIIAILAIAFVLSFIVSFDDILKSNGDIVTTSPTEDTTNVCEHVLNSKCVCVLCGAVEHTWDSSSADDCAQRQICFECEAENGPYGPHKDFNGDYKCDLCNTNM